MRVALKFPDNNFSVVEAFLVDFVDDSKHGLVARVFFKATEPDMEVDDNNPDKITVIGHDIVGEVAVVPISGKTREELTLELLKNGFIDLTTHTVDVDR